MWLVEPFRAPEFPLGATWLNHEPRFSDRSSTVWLIQFWSYTDLACLETLPYLSVWHDRYSPLGLTIVGIHTPQFRFARQQHLVEWAVAEFGIRYPILLDNYHHLRLAYGTDSWPSQYLMDGLRWVRYAHLGTGQYEESEGAIHTMLHRSDTSLDLQPVMRPLARSDGGRPGILPPTPDLDAGYVRGRFGDLDGYVYDHTVMYADPGAREEGVLYAHGQWHTSGEFLAFMGESGYLAFTYQAAGVNAIISPTWDEIALMLGLREGPIPRVEVSLDGAPVPPTEAGRDVVYGSRGDSYVMVDRPRLYNLTRHPEVALHEICLTFRNRDVAVYQFSFIPSSAGPRAESPAGQCDHYGAKPGTRRGQGVT